MKLSEAMKIIESPISGFRVSFERKEGSLLVSDFFPDRGEPLIQSMEDAWALAESFAVKTVGKCVNILVIDSGFSPVANYRNRMIHNRSIKP